MSIIDIKKSQLEVENALSEKRIKEALEILGGLSKHHHGGVLIDEHYNLEYTYKSMLKYTMEGIEDPERDKVYQNIIFSCYNLSDKLFSSIYNHSSPNLFYETRRQFGDLYKTNIHNLGNELASEITKNELAKQANIVTSSSDTILTRMYNRIWVAEEIDQFDFEYLKNFYLDKTIHFSYKCIFISALTIGSLQEFNLSKISLLFDLVNHTDETVKQRAITGVLLNLFKYNNRISLYKDIISRLKILQEDNKFINNTLTIVIQLIRTLETEKISKKLNDEILPEVVKMQPNLRNKLDLENLISDKFAEGENPEWEDFFKDSPELMSKLEELTELQMEGSDVFLSTFKMLKHFSFFNKTHNWFMPFFIENKEISETVNDNNGIFSSKTIQDSLANSGFLCNSDKYSLFLSIPHMPHFQKEMMGNMFKQQLEQMDEIENSEKMISPNKQASIISNRYIQDLYRFYKIHPQHSQFEDIFAWRMDFHNKSFFQELLSDITQMRQIGEFFFKKEYFKEASEVFNLICKNEPENVEIIQKTAYCFQQLKQYANALNLYLKADIMKPGQVWNTKKIALMYKLLKQPQKALEYNIIAESLKPDDLHTQASIGHCHLDLKNYKEALKYYFKVEYLDESNTKVWRPIAWCSFVTNNLIQAEKYYHKLLVSSNNKHDLINMGHIFLCKNNKIEALKYYQKAIDAMGESKKEFFDTFSEDIPQLLTNGINIEDIPIILDQIKYMLDI